MKAIRVVTIICWLIAAVALLGLAVWFLTGTVFGIHSDSWSTGDWIPRFSLGFNVGGWESLSGPYNEAGTYTVKTAGIDSINIDWIASGVDVKPYDGADIKITEYAQRELREDEKAYINTSGGTLTVKFREQGVSVRMPQKKLEVLVPGALCENLNKFQVDSASGSVNVSGLGAKTFKTDAISGSVNISDITAGTFDVSTTSGSISVKHVGAEGIKLESISGSIRLSDSSAGTVKCNTMSGSINTAGTFDSIGLGSISGSLTLDSLAAIAVLDAESSSGSLNLSGAFGTVKTESISGTTTIKSSIVPSSLKVETTSGGINIHIPDEGAITVKHSSVSGRFSSDVPITLQNSGAQFNIETISGSARIYVLN